MMVGRMWALWMVIVLMFTGECWSHGRLVEPPSRATAWRLGWNTPADYNDNEGNCGGMNYQYQTQGGKCGTCGDAWDENPRPHEGGGLYATGTIVSHYAEAQVITIKVDITANHRGYFEFKICPQNNPSVPVSQTCLDEHPLFLADGSGFRYPIPTYNGDHIVQVRLPPGLTCTHCVLQWRYVGGNNWGICEDGTGRLGCGPQEEFRACADVEVSSQQTWTSDGTVNKTEATTTEDMTNKPSSPPTIPSTTPSTQATEGTRPTGTRSSTTTTEAGEGTSSQPRNCRAVEAWQQIANMDEWCIMNCLHTPSYCPATHCICD